MTEKYSPRIRVDIVAAYSCAGSYTFGIVTNISSSGLFLESRKLLPVDTAPGWPHTGLLEGESLRTSVCDLRD